MLSVCMATYNGERFIHKQIESILSQLDENDELVISDDGSNDNTIPIIKSFNDKRINIFYNEQHGVTHNFENALRHSKGDYICLSDQDDVWHEGKTEFVKKKLQEYDLIIHNADIVDGNGKSLGYDYFSIIPYGNGFWGNLWKSRFLGCCMAFNRRLLNYALPFPNEIVGHDYWIGMLGTSKFKAIFDKSVYLSYRRHGDNVSTSAEPSNSSWCYKIFKKRLGIIWCIICRSFRNLD